MSHLRNAFVVAVVAAAAIVGSNLGAQTKPAAPVYQAELMWPKPLPNHWLVGSITGVAVDAQDHIWVAHRPDSLALNNEAGLAANPPGAEYCCQPAPPILEFDAAGNLLASWGGPGTGYDWPVSTGGIAIDDKGNLWIAAAGPPEPAVAGRNATGGGGGGAPRGAGAAGGGAAGTAGGAAGGAAGGGRAGGGGGRAAAPARPADAQVLKFSPSGQFILQIGHAGQTGAADSTTELDRPAAIAIDSAANELFVADGGTHQRIVVFDATTGAFKRQWKADWKMVSRTATLASQNLVKYPVMDFARLSSIVVSKDGHVYVGDRRNNAIQVFDRSGAYQDQFIISRQTTGNGSVWGIGLSSDYAQQRLFVADGQDEKVWVLDRFATREDQQVITTFGDGGRQPGQFYAVNNVAMDSKGVVYTGEGYEGKRLQKWVRK